MDDIIVFGSSKEEHDQNLKQVLATLKDAGVTLNREKCSFGKKELKFLGHVVSSEGIKSDPDKIKAIVELDKPTNVSLVRQLLGMVNQFSKFVPNLSYITRPIRDLLKKNVEFVWGLQQDESFKAIKKMLMSTPILAIYDPNAELRLLADASSYGLGCVLEQKEGKYWKPISYGSKSLSDAEKSLAQIEKEALAITWACEKHRNFLIGKQFNVMTDHKPLIAILNTKNLDELSPRLLRLRLRLLNYNFSITHVVGKDFYTPDVLSRCPLGIMESKDNDCFLPIFKEAEEIEIALLQSIPATKE